MFERILIVCVGNICRSPMAEGVMKKKLQSLKPDIQISSAGLEALVGHPADSVAQQVVQPMGVDLSAHRGRQLNRQLLKQAELILVMEDWQKEVVIQHRSDCRGKVYKLGHWISTEVPDPYRKSEEMFHQVLNIINRSVDAWSKKL